MRISKIILENFRGYDYEEIEFNRFNCIVGKNDVGKSTIFEAIKWFFDTSLNDADENFNIDLLENIDDDQYIYENGIAIGWNEEYSPTIDIIDTMTVEIRFCEVNEDLKYVESIFKDNLDKVNKIFTNNIFFINDFLNESNELCIKKVIEHSSKYNKRQIPIPTYSIMTKQIDGFPPMSLWDRETLCKQYLDIFGEDKKLIRPVIICDSKFNTSRTEKRNTNSMITQIRTHFTTTGKYKHKWMVFDKNKIDFLSILPKVRIFNTNTYSSEYDSVIQDYFNSFLSKIKFMNILQGIVEKEIKSINDILNETISNKLYLKPKLSCKFNISFEFSNGIASVGLKQRGEGIRQILMNTIVQYISNKEIGNNSIFLFEEPESHLHPDAQKDYYKILIKLSEQHNQVMITTHSPYIVSMCDINDIIQIKKIGAYPLVYQKNNTSLQDVIEDLGIGPNDSMLSIFDNYKSILFVEGKNDNYTLNKISELYKKKKDKKGKIVDKTFEEMKCLIMFIGGCSTVEEWANLGIVTKLAKPFVILLDSDKKNSGHISNNQKKLDNIYKTLNDSIETSKQAKINFCKDNFITTRKRELENYIKPSVIENYYNKKSDKNLRDEEIEDIQDIMEMIENVELSIIAFVYKHDKSIKKYTTEALDNIPVENKKEKRRQIRKEKTIELLNNYKKEYQKFNSEFQFKEWLYCKVKGIDINHYTEYKDVIGKRSYIYCMEKEIDIEKYKEIYNQCKWIDNNYHYLISYVKHIDQMSGVDLTKLDSMEKFENVLDSNMKEEITHIEQAIKNTTITDVITDFCFSNEIKDNWEYIDVPLAIYCCKGHLDYNEELPDKKSKCESIKVEINKYFFEEGNINYEDLDFTYGNDQDEFLDIYNKIKKLSK